MGRAIFAILLVAIMLVFGTAALVLFLYLVGVIG
jgi:hypothetical protein